MNNTNNYKENHTKKTNGKNGNGHHFPSKKFLFVSDQSQSSGDLAWQIKNEGHDVKLYIGSKSDRDVMNGFLPKVNDWKKFVSWADVIVFDFTGFGKDAERLRKKGKLVIGGNIYTDKLEEDREFGQSEMKKFGLSVMSHWDFNNFDEAIEFIKANPERYVFKPSGDTSNHKSILFLGNEEDGKDLIEILEQNKTLWAKKIKKFQLQSRAVGVEVAVGAFFNGKDFIYPINVNFEHKKLFPGDIGPYTGEMGTLMFWGPQNEIFRETLLKFKDKLAKTGYVGYIDINCIANAKGIYPLEFTCRFGYPTINIQMEGVTSPWGEFLYQLAKKENIEIKIKKGFQIGVVVAVPPFPYHDYREANIYKNLSILFKKENLEGLHPWDIKMVNGVWTIAGNGGYALIVTGSGTTVEDARKQAYNRLNNVMLQNMYYRTDIGLKWTTDSDKLQTWGYMY
jgi:phosphoribosylamine--glycine ligase